MIEQATRVFGTFAGNMNYVFISFICLMLMWHKREKIWTIAFPATFIAFLLINPLVVYILELFLEEDRLTKLWLAFPLMIVIAYTIAENAKEKKTIALLLVGMVLLGNCFFTSGSFTKWKNFYKVDEAVIQICDSIEADASEAGLPQRNIKVLAEEPLNYYIRLYDPNIILEAGRYIGNEQNAHALMDLLDKTSIDGEQIAELARESSVDYLVVRKARRNQKSLLEQGFTLVEEKYSYNIYHLR